jgi:hypothetical protein
VVVVAATVLWGVIKNQVALDARTFLLLCAFIYTYPVVMRLSYGVFRVASTLVAALAVLAIAASGFRPAVAVGAVTLVDVLLFVVLAFLPQRFRYQGPVPAAHAAAVSGGRVAGAAGAAEARHPRGVH